ncbi:MAG: autotransporter domain-containing protein [Alphaproteobacteria bacterium]|nr:autotransporter domain-containing protein [Alphaproteobacteria bacterium]
MNGKTRNKARLLAHASTVAILAAAGQFGVVAEAQAACTNISGATVISSDIECARVYAPVTGDVTNNANIGEPEDEDNAAAFFVGGEGGTLNGVLTNNNTITGGDATYGALTIGDGGNISGGIRNFGQILSGAGNAIALGYASSAAAMTGNITNSNVINGAVNGVAALYGTNTGGLLNNSGGSVTGGNAGVLIADSFTSWTGGIDNFGNILGDEAGIQVGSFASGGEGLVFDGGIENYGSISSLSGPSVIAGGSSFGGGIYNGGVITQRDASAAGGEGFGAGVGILVSAETFNGSITNDYSGVIEGLGGQAIWVTNQNSTFNGNISNFGVIRSTSGSFDAVGLLVNSSTFNGNVENYGLIDASNGGVVIDVGEFHGNIRNQDRIFGGKGPGLSIFADVIDGGGEAAAEIFNNNRIQGADGVVIQGGDVVANFTNQQETYFGAPEAAIVGDSGVGVAILADSWTGDITNSGRITGQEFDFGGEYGGEIGQLVNGVSGVGLYVVTSSFEGNITNSGLIEGDSTGAEIYLSAFDGGECTYSCTPGSFAGNIVNNGTISGGFTGLELEFGGEAGGTFEGTITNNGWIDGGQTGAVIDLDGGEFTGNIVNNGTITGGNDALNIFFGAFDGDITNNGTIHGGIDGLNIEGNSFTGNVTNNGTIIGEGVDTALYINLASMTGNVINTNYLSASSNAMHLIIGTLTGQVTNSGHIEAFGGGTAVDLNIGNGTTFTNTGGGFIEGDVEFNGASSVYVFSAGNGRIEGSLLGVGTGGVNNDTIVVNGTHSFTDGTAQNFSSFTVQNNGLALMGANSMGGPSASPYSFTNVDALAVNSGGTLYIDQGVTLNVDNSYTQAAGGTLMFDLGAPAGIATTSGTITALAGDYGSIIVGGPVTLSGTIAGFLDSAFATADPGLETVFYNDVIVSTSPIIGGFSDTALVANNSLFQLFDLIDGNTVDLRVSRAPLGQFPGLTNIVNTVDPFDGNVADRTNGIGSGGCGLAGPGSCFNRFAANEPGATQVMTDATPGEDPFGWLRTGVRRVGETAVWGRGVGVLGDTDGEAGLGIPGSDFSLGGAIVGVDHVFTTTLLAGLAAQWTTTDVDFDGRRDNADVNSYEVGAYGSWGDTRLYLNANVSYIWHDFEIRRFDAATTARGSYDGNTFSAYAEGGKIFETESGFRIQPIVALSYAHLDTDAYSETGTAATLLNVFAADLDTLKGMIGGRFAYPFQMDSGRKWVPEARLVWAHEFMDDHASHIVDVQGGPFVPTLVSGETFSRDTLIAGAGLTVPVSDDATAFVDYDAGLNSDVTTHTVSAGMRVRW